MKKFKYKAKRGPEEILEGSLMAHSQEDAIDQINEMGLFAVHIDEDRDVLDHAKQVGPRHVKQGVKGHDLILFYRQLAKLSRSGIPMLRAVGLISEQTTSHSLKGLLVSLQQGIQEGQSLSSSLALHPKVFRDLDVAMVHVGESTGHLERVLDRVADYREQHENLISKVWAALMYPAFIVLLGLFTVIFMLSYVIPQYAQFFSGLGQDLPLITRILIGVSQWVKHMWLWLVALPAAAALFGQLALRRPDTKIAWDGFLLKVPQLGYFLLRIEMASLCRTLQSLIASGVQLIRALPVAIPTLRNEAIRYELEQSHKALAQGSSFSESVRRIQVFPRFMHDIIRIGEESGKLDEALGEVADWYEREIQTVVQTVTKLLEPLLILCVGLVVGFIVVAMLLPVFSINVMVQ